MNKYRPLPESTKSVLYFNAWIMWATRTKSEEEEEEFDTDYYAEYEKLRHWCVDEIVNNEVSYQDIPTVSIVNQNEVFKRARRELDLKKFKNISTHDFYLERDDSKIKPKAR
jgi:hypothetical protein